MRGLKNKAILITGANGQLGHAIAKRLSEEGAYLVLTDKTQELSIESLKKLPKKIKAINLFGDISNPQDVIHIVQKTVEKHDDLYAIVNTATTFEPEDAGLLTTSIETWQRTLSTNLTGTFLMCQSVIPTFKKNGRGVVINLSSVVAHVASAEAQIAYTTSKGGMEAMTREIAMEYARSNIRANCIAPGPIRTKRTAHYFDSEEKWKKRRQHIPMGKTGQATEVAGLVAFLLSEDANYITGSSYLIDGGIANAYVVNDINGHATA